MAVVTSKEFNQRASEVLKIAEAEPVYITKWGKVVSVLTSYAHYQAQSKPQTLAEAFSSGHPAGSLTNDVEQDLGTALKEVRNQSQMNVPDFVE